MSHYILAVDDTPDNLFLIQLALEQEGYHIVTVDNGGSALEVIAQSPPDLILLDVMMPKMDGYEVTRRIRSHPNLPYIPILLITAHQHSSVVQGLDAGADEFIRKPVQIDELQARVRALLRLKQAIDQRENFISCLTHDLRTPILAANRVIQLIQEGVYGEVTAKTDQMLCHLVDNNQHLLQMLNTLLEVHHYEDGQKQLSLLVFDVVQLIEEIIREQIPLAQAKNLEVNFQLNTEITTIEGDRWELRRVFANLIANAIKFTDQGSVEISLSEFTPGLESYLAIAVKDTGVGISIEDQEHIFNRFRQGKNRRAGHGLGLHLCCQIVQAHQGQIKVESKLNRGSCFTVYLPLKGTQANVSI